MKIALVAMASWCVQPGCSVVRDFENNQQNETLEEGDTLLQSRHLYGQDSGELASGDSNAEGSGGFVRKDLGDADMDEMAWKSGHEEFETNDPDDSNFDADMDELVWKSDHTNGDVQVSSVTLSQQGSGVQGGGSGAFVTEDLGDADMDDLVRKSGHDEFEINDPDGSNFDVDMDDLASNSGHEEVETNDLDASNFDVGTWSHVLSSDPTTDDVQVPNITLSQQGSGVQAYKPEAGTISTLSNGQHWCFDVWGPYVILVHCGVDHRNAAGVTAVAYWQKWTFIGKTIRPLEDKRSCIFASMKHAMLFVMKCERPQHVWDDSNVLKKEWEFHLDGQLHLTGNSGNGVESVMFHGPVQGFNGGDGSACCPPSETKAIAINSRSDHPQLRSFVFRYPGTGPDAVRSVWGWYRMSEDLKVAKTYEATEGWESTKETEVTSSFEDSVVESSAQSVCISGEAPIPYAPGASVSAEACAEQGQETSRTASFSNMARDSFTRSASSTNAWALPWEAIDKFNLHLKYGWVWKIQMAAKGVDLQKTFGHKLLATDKWCATDGIRGVKPICHPLGMGQSQGGYGCDCDCEIYVLSTLGDKDMQPHCHRRRRGTGAARRRWTAPPPASVDSGSKGTYIILNNGPGCTSSADIVTADACTLAAKELGVGKGRKASRGSWGHSPKGCLYDGWKYIYFNSIAGRTGRSGIKSICQR